MAERALRRLAVRRKPRESPSPRLAAQVGANVCITTGVKLRGREGAQRLRATSASTAELCRFRCARAYLCGALIDSLDSLMTLSSLNSRVVLRYWPTTAPSVCSTAH